jgi:hypothetical protein
MRLAEAEQPRDFTGIDARRWWRRQDISDIWLSDVSREGVQTTTHIGYLSKLTILWF